jgi:hypothetical protein
MTELPAPYVNPMTSYYAQQQDLINYWGATTVQQWSDVDGTGTTNTTRIGLALQQADAQINAKFSAPSCAGWFTVSATGLTGMGPLAQALTKFWACVIAGAWLYQTRGLFDDQWKNKLSPLVDKVQNDMAMSASRNSGFDAGPSWPVGDVAPVPHTPNENGAPSSPYY